MNIRLTLYKSLIIESVKNETFHRGQFDKAADQKAAVAAFHEQAGDETYHERILQRSLTTNLSSLKTLLSDYLTASGELAGHNITEETNNDQIILILNVSERFNTSYTDALAKLAAEYVANAMLMDWWRPVNGKQSELYATFLQKNTADIQRCFSKTAPKVPVYKYPTAIDIRYPLIETSNGIPGYITPANSQLAQEVLFGNPWRISEGEDSEISYTLSGENGEDPVDDIMVRVDNGRCCHARLNAQGRYYLHAVQKGYAIVTLFSRHDSRVFATFAVRVV